FQQLRPVSKDNTIYLLSDFNGRGGVDRPGRYWEYRGATQKDLDQQGFWKDYFTSERTVMGVTTGEKNHWAFTDEIRKYFQLDEKFNAHQALIGKPSGLPLDASTDPRALSILKKFNSEDQKRLVEWLKFGQEETIQALRKLTEGKQFRELDDLLGK